MKRRSFLSVFTGAIAAAAVSARLIREEVIAFAERHPGQFRGYLLHRTDERGNEVNPYIMRNGLLVLNPKYIAAMNETVVIPRT